MMELVSVIVPIYNVEKYLVRCVDSIRSQTYKNLEIILVDDGSQDNCPQICEQIKREDPRVKVIHKENAGLGYARNSGLDLASGTYVTFIDSDDWISKDHINNLVNAITENIADVAIGGHTTVDTKGITIERYVRLETGNYEGVDIAEKIILPMLGAKSTEENDVGIEPSSCMILYRMEAINKFGLRFRSERIAASEDLYFNVDFLMHITRAVVTNEIGYFYFENSTSISRKYNPKLFERTVNYYYAICEQVKQYGLEDAASVRIDRCFLMKLRVAIIHIVSADLPYRQKIQQIQEILNHGITMEVLKNYPIETYIPAIRILAKWMRAKNAVGVYWLVKLRECARRQIVLKKNTEMDWYW